MRAESADPGHIAAFVYGGAIGEAIRRVKFDGRPDVIPALLAGLRVPVERLERRAGERVVPVPLHASRLVERGYNQSALLAAGVARLLGAPFEPRGLLRLRATDRQTDLSGVARRANVSAAFIVGRATSLLGQPVLLVDDVETTGATLAACAEALVQSGAGPIRTLVVARTDFDATVGRP